MATGYNTFKIMKTYYTSCSEMSESRRSVKLKDMKNFPLYAPKLLAWPQTDFRPPGLHKTVASRQGFIPRATHHAFPLTNPRHTLLSCTILLVCPTSKPLFFKQSFMVSIHLFRDLPTERLPAHTPK